MVFSSSFYTAGMLPAGYTNAILCGIVIIYLLTFNFDELVSEFHRLELFASNHKFHLVSSQTRYFLNLFIEFFNIIFTIRKDVRFNLIQILN